MFLVSYGARFSTVECQNDIQLYFICECNLPRVYIKYFNIICNQEGGRHTCQQISTSGPTPRWWRNTSEHSGSSPRSANSDSSSSLIGNTNGATSASANIGLSRTRDDVVSMSPNHPTNSSPTRPANLSSDSGSGSGSG